MSPDAGRFPRELTRGMKNKVFWLMICCLSLFLNILAICSFPRAAITMSINGVVQVMETYCVQGLGVRHKGWRRRQDRSFPEDLQRELVSSPAFGSPSQLLACLGLVESPFLVCLCSHLWFSLCFRSWHSLPSSQFDCYSNKIPQTVCLKNKYLVLETESLSSEC